MPLRLSDDVVLRQQLTGQKATPIHAASLLDKRFNTPDPRRCPVVLLVDEVSTSPLNFEAYNNNNNTCSLFTINLINCTIYLPKGSELKK